MSSLLYILSCILFQTSLGQVSFTEVASTQIFYPRYKINLGSNPCGLSVCQSCIEIRCNNGVIRNSNQMWDDEYAWSYENRRFEPPLTFVMTKSNNDIITFTNLISDYNTSRTFPTGQQFCPTPSPISPPISANPTNNPSITPTKYPTNSLTKTPTKNSSITPNVSQTNYSSYLPTNNPTVYPTINSANTTAQSTTANTITSENTNIQSTPTTNPIVNTAFMEEEQSENEGISASTIIIGVIICFGFGVIIWYCRVYHQKKIKKGQSMETHIGMNGTKSNSTNGIRSSDTPSCTPEPVSLEIKQSVQNGNNVIGVINTVNMGMTPATYATTNNPMGSTYMSTYPTIPGMSKMGTLNIPNTDRNALIMMNGDVTRGVISCHD